MGQEALSPMKAQCPSVGECQGKVAGVCVGACTLIERGARVGYRVSEEKLERGITFEM